MMHRSLPGLAAMHLGREQLSSSNGGASATYPPSLPTRLSLDATRELARCANGECVSHDVVRDGIDALLQLKRASFDANTTNVDGYVSWKEKGVSTVLRTGPERPFVPCPPLLGPPWSECVMNEEESSDDDEEQDDDDCSSCRSNTPPPEQRRSSEIKQKPRITKNRTAPPPKKLVKPLVNRPPTIWHRRRKDAQPLNTPKSPKSEPSPAPTITSDVDDDEGSGPAVLHFSCLQCHRAKKRCNRTRPCSRCVIRGMQDDCRYPDKHDPRSVLRACLRCWQTKKKCDRKQPCCGKCEKVGVKCVYRRELQQDSPEESTSLPFQVPTPSLTLSPPPVCRSSRLPSDASLKAGTPPPTVPTISSKKRKLSENFSTEDISAKRVTTAESAHHYSTRHRETRNSVKAEDVFANTSSDLIEEMESTADSTQHKRLLRSRK